MAGEGRVAGGGTGVDASGIATDQGGDQGGMQRSENRFGNMAERRPGSCFTPAFQTVLGVNGDNHTPDGLFHMSRTVAAGAADRAFDQP